MASIRQLRSGNWNVQIRERGKPARSQTFHSERKARKWAAMNEGGYKFRHQTFYEAGMNYCNTILFEKASSRLKTLQIERIAKNKEFNVAMDEIRLKHLNAYRQMRLIRVSTTTCRDELMMIRRVFRWYLNEVRAERELIMPDPCEFLVLPKARKTRDKVISRTELKQLLEKMTPEMAVVVELAFETAMRRSEILKLTKDDLCLEQRFLRVVDGKEGSRDVPLTRRAVSLLESTQERQVSSGGRLYPMAAYSVTQAVRRAREALGMSSDIRFHQLRHSRISEVARKGLNQAQIMIISGHKDIRSVQRYTHLNVQDVLHLID
ncbi:tyrosine-type recombinase/integrase [Falsihalocynthiibacter sp. S25ZX9]|uniref:tyrosine-type recombinase/integrase n=1 Tax=Falsihalocynthiibacter sp. S25ZX9 TaxID=3240870 RepID=UPI003510BFD6